MGISPRTIQRWRTQPDVDDRRVGPHRRPRNALTPTEESRIVATLTDPKHAGLSPKQLVPRLADEGVYVGSESTFRRVIQRRGLRRRGRPLASRDVARATTMHRADGPNQVWSWDITWLPTTVGGRFFHLYLVMDVWSRRIVGTRVETSESSAFAAALIRDASHGVDHRGLVLHADNGTAMRGRTMLAMLQRLGVIPSFSRPHVSDDNPYSEALFRTLKHTRARAPHLFENVDDARRWVAGFVDWYNTEHRHCAIRYVTPDERHFGREHDVLTRRQEVYARARRAHPERWTRTTRDWSPIRTVTLNPMPAEATA